MNNKLKTPNTLLKDWDEFKAGRVKLRTWKIDSKTNRRTMSHTGIDDFCKDKLMKKDKNRVSYYENTDFSHYIRTKTTRFCTAEYLKSEKDIAGYLKAVLEEGNDDLMVLAKKNIAKARRMIKNSLPQKQCVKTINVKTIGKKTRRS